jgi:hypothetical protein
LSSVAERVPDLVFFFFFLLDFLRFFFFSVMDRPLVEVDLIEIREVAD